MIGARPLVLRRLGASASARVWLASFGSVVVLSGVVVFAGLGLTWLPVAYCTVWAGLAAVRGAWVARISVTDEAVVVVTPMRIATFARKNVTGVRASVSPAEVIVKLGTAWVLTRPAGGAGIGQPGRSRFLADAAGLAGVVGVPVEVVAPSEPVPPGVSVATAASLGSWAGVLRWPLWVALLLTGVIAVL